jgi:hypothetical protein
MCQVCSVPQGALENVCGFNKRWWDPSYKEDTCLVCKHFRFQHEIRAILLFLRRTADIINSKFENICLTLIQIITSFIHAFLILRYKYLFIFYGVVPYESL